MSKVTIIPGIEAGVRCYPIRQKQRKKGKRAKTRALPKNIFVFDTETLTDHTQALTFGSWRLLRRPDDAPAGSLDYPCLQEGIFYAEDAPPDAIERLRAYVATRRADVDVDRGGESLIKLESQADFLNGTFYKITRKMRALVTGFNLPFDCSRLAYSCGRARKTMRGGFSFVLWTRKEKGVMVENKWRPRLTIKSLDSTKAFIRFARVNSDDWTDRIPEGSTSGKPVPGYFHHGNFLDLRTLSFSLTDKKMGLDAACKAFNVERKGDPGQHPGWDFDDAYIDYNRRDVRVSAQLLLAMLLDFALHPIDLAPMDVYSPASIAKANLRALGVSPPLVRWPNLDPADLGRVAGTFFGGRTSAHVRKTVVPVVYTDFLSMYTTVNGLLRQWDLITAKDCVVEECTEEARSLLASIAPDPIAGLNRCFDPSVWSQFCFFAEVALAGDVVPVRGRYARGESRQIGVNPAWCDRPLWYAGPDLVASCLLSEKGTPPRILRAIRYVPARNRGEIVKIPSLRAINLLGGERLDPTRDDLFLHVIEARMRAKQNPLLDDNVKARRNTGLKVVANSLYGIFAETNVVDTKDGKPEEVEVHAFDGTFRTSIDKPEEPGAFSFPPVASLITSGARLMLAMLERCVTDQGGTYAMEDTDSMPIIATEQGGLVPCPGGPHPYVTSTPRSDAGMRTKGVRNGRVSRPSRNPRAKTDSAKRGVKPEALYALSWAQVKAIVARFGALNPYDRTVAPGSVLKIEDINFRSDGSQRQLQCYAISSKRYAIFELIEGEPCFRFDTPDTTWGKPKTQYSEHGLGHLMNPTDPDSNDRAWVEETWKFIVRGSLGLKVDEPAWLDRPAMTRLPVSTPFVHTVFDAFNEERTYAENVKPFGFMIAPQTAVFGIPPEADSKRFRLVAPYSSNSRRWLKDRFYNAHDGTLYAIRTDMSSPALFKAPVTVVETYRGVLDAFPWHAEPKSASPNGIACDQRTVGLLFRRNVRISRVDYLGKEANAIDDPITGALSGTIGDEDTTTRRYVRPEDDPLGPLRTVMQAIPTAYFVEHARLSERQVRRIRNGRVRPSAANLREIGVAIRHYVREQGDASLDALSALTAHAQRAEVEAQAHDIYEIERVAQASYWESLDEAGGRIVPDLVCEHGLWRERGEFTDLPRALVRRNHKRSPNGTIKGNLDLITDAVRNRSGNDEVSTSDVLGFFVEHARPSLAGARREALDRAGEPAAQHELGQRLLDALGLLGSAPDNIGSPNRAEVLEHLDREFASDW